MLDSDIEAIYKMNVNESHYAALRAVWDDGYNYALSISSPGSVDPSNTATVTTAVTDDPTIVTP